MGISIGNSEISTATGIYCGSRKLRPDGGGGGWKIEDSFSGTSLNSDIWDSKLWNNVGSITVNNGLTLSNLGSNGGPMVYTKKTFTGNEKLITAEIRITSEGGTYMEAKRGILPSTTTLSSGRGLYIISQNISTYNNTTRAFYETSATADSVLYSVAKPGIPYDLKIVLNCEAGTWQIYENGNTTYTGNVEYALTNCIGRPIFGMDAIGSSGMSCVISGVKLSVE